MVTNVKQRLFKFVSLSNKALQHLTQLTSPYVFLLPLLPVLNSSLYALSSWPFTALFNPRCTFWITILLLLLPTPGMPLSLPPWVYIQLNSFPSFLSQGLPSSECVFCLFFPYQFLIFDKHHQSQSKILFVYLFKLSTKKTRMHGELVKGSVKSIQL